MKTYILRAPKAVEPQKPQRKPLPHPLHSDPDVTAMVAAICWPSSRLLIHGRKVRVVGGGRAANV